jgi:hypothetical protein
MFTLKVFALLVFGLLANVASAAPGPINNDAWLRSTDGQPIFTHSGYVAKFGSTYYYYGEQYVGSQTYYQTGTRPTGGDAWVSTNVYTSTDLINWTPKVVAWNGAGYVQPGDWVGRLWGVLFNASINRYVMWVKYQGANGFGGLVLTSTSPTGPFTVDHLQTSFTNIFSTPPVCGDSKFFYAANGTPYLACSDSHGRQRAYVAPLSSDYKTINPVIQIALWPEGQEGNTALYAPTENRYFYFTSETNGWSYSHAFVVNSTSVSSGYTGRVILPGTDATNTYWSQTVQALSIPGSSGTAYVMLCDRWNLFSGNYASAGHGTGYNVWEPLTLSGSSATFSPLQTWFLDAAAGTWSTTGGGTTLTVSPSSQSFSAAAGSQNVSITSNTSWTASDNQSWITVSPTSGSNNGSTTVSVTANTGASRSGAVTITGGSITRTVSVSQSGPGGGGPVTYQAESATLGGGASTESSSAGFNGTGYVNFPTNAGTSQFNNADGGGGGAKTLVIRFALLSGSRTGTLTINGVSQNITFNSTGAWTTWATMNVAVTLTSGTTNTIRLASTGQDLANVDQITIQ